MATNTTILIVVTALVALVLASALAGVVYKTRTPKRVEVVRDPAEEDALRLRRQERLADEYAARAHSARVEIDIKTIQACGLEEQAAAQRSEAVTSREQLNELRDSADKLSAAARPSGMPRLAG
jgi:hypothetical protein